MYDIEKSFFEFNGRNSLDFGIRILKKIIFPIPEPDYEFVEILGRDGDLTIDNKRNKPFEIAIAFKLRPDNGQSIEELVREINRWIFNSRGQQDLFISFYPQYQLRAIVQKGINIEQQLSKHGQGEIIFKCQPRFYLLSGLEKIQVKNKMIINNVYNREAYPIIDIYGTGDVDIVIQDQQLVIKKINGHIRLDSEYNIVDDFGNPAFDKVYTYPLPKLRKGKNYISYNNKNMKITIIPKWSD